MQGTEQSYPPISESTDSPIGFFPVARWSAKCACKHFIWSIVPPTPPVGDIFDEPFSRLTLCFL